jgi:hypothetical protein
VKYKSVQLPGTGELETLQKVLPHVNYVESGVAGKPTIRFSGVNVQILNGEGATESTNGEGNLVIGYDELPRTQTGSHNLIIGDAQSFSSYGGIVAGLENTISGPDASVTGGVANEASGSLSSISGGERNKAIVEGTSVSGGLANSAENFFSWIGGGRLNKVEGAFSAIFGGKELTAKGEYEAIP